MVAPASTSYASYSFRDAKGQVSKMRLLIGAASSSALVTAIEAATPLLQAVSNAHVYGVTINSQPDHTYGVQADYQDVEDKANLTFLDYRQAIHRYQVPAPKTVEFKTDQQTVDSSETNMAALIAFFAASVYGTPADTSPLVYSGGLRIRRKNQRRMSIFTKGADDSIPAE